MRKWTDRGTLSLDYRDAELHVECKLIVHHFLDCTDADGNRGVMRTLIDDFTILAVTDADGNAVEVTPELRESITKAMTDAGWRFDELMSEI